MYFENAKKQFENLQQKDNVKILANIIGQIFAKINYS